MGKIVREEAFAVADAFSTFIKSFVQDTSFESFRLDLFVEFTTGQCYTSITE